MTLISTTAPSTIIWWCQAAAAERLARASGRRARPAFRQDQRAAPSRPGRVVVRSAARFPDHAVRAAHARFPDHAGAVQSRRRTARARSRPSAYLPRWPISRASESRWSDRHHPFSVAPMANHPLEGLWFERPMRRKARDVILFSTAAAGARGWQVELSGPTSSNVRLAKELCSSDRRCQREYTAGGAAHICCVTTRTPRSFIIFRLMKTNV